MSTQHTPGPWELSEYTWKDGAGTYRRVEQVEEFGDVVASVCIGHSANHTLDACANANARLIAAAPDLLEAILICEGNIASLLASNHPKVYGEWLAVVRAAIAKATGDV